MYVAIIFPVFIAVSGTNFSGSNAVHHTCFI